MPRQLRVEYPGAMYKVQLAQRLRKETTLSVRQIAARLHLGTPKSASFRLLSHRKAAPSGQSSQFSLGLRGGSGNIEA